MTRTDFGYRSVPLEEKQRLVDEVFRSVAGRYDLMNDLMSGGLHRAWKDALVAKLRPPRGERPWRLLDVAGGTGDVALRALAAAGSGAHAIVADPNADMLAVGRRHAATLSRADRFEFVLGNAEALPFPDRHFDAVTIAFGIRNVTRMETALSEMRRVLQYGGHFLCLEFSQVDVPGLDALYERYSFGVIPELGRLVTGDADAYRYLVESIRRFPDRHAFAERIRAAGFARVRATPLTGGIVALHSAWRT
jgi:demethylmenaquinone methyltransferase/2-methoxy-6-polyprenyl-1,4-benzoquinol methylase